MFEGADVDGFAMENNLFLKSSLDIRMVYVWPYFL